jgi:hypothetical protein
VPQDRRHENATQIIRRIARRVIFVSDLAWNIFRVLAYCVLPVAFATFEVVDILVRTGHRQAAWGVLAQLLAVGICILIIALAPPETFSRRPSPTVRRLNRRAAMILPAAGLVLASLWAVIAIKPVLLGLVGVVLLLVGVPALGSLGGHELIELRRRRRVTRTNAPPDKS